MTVETVDQALEEVRPYLIADGGNVTVLDVVDGTVMLQLDVSCHINAIAFLIGGVLSSWRPQHHCDV